MVTLKAFPNVYCPTCRGVQLARFEVLKADAYIDHDSLDIVCSQCRSVIGSLHADKPNQNARWKLGELADSIATPLAIIPRLLRRGLRRKRIGILTITGRRACKAASHSRPGSAHQLSQAR